MFGPIFKTSIHPSDVDIVSTRELLLGGWKERRVCELWSIG